MSGLKEKREFELNGHQVAWLEEMAKKYALPDADKALRIVLDFTRMEADSDHVFTQIRCSNC